MAPIFTGLKLGFGSGGGTNIPAFPLTPRAGISFGAEIRSDDNDINN
jgi:hypothetical protein